MYLCDDDDDVDDGDERKLHISSIKELKKLIAIKMRKIT